MAYQVLSVSMNAIQVNPYQPRQSPHFDPDKLQELAHSIQTVGLLHPPVVRPLETGLYELIAGERRYRAAKLAGLDTIPVLVQPHTHLSSALSALIENLQREDLNPIDTALGLKNLAEEFKMTYEQVAQSIGMNRATLSNQIRLLSLPNLIQKGLIQKEISRGHAKALLALDNEGEQVSLFQVIIQKKLSVRETEARVIEKKKKKERPKPTSSSVKNIFLQQIKDSLQEKLGTKVSFSGDEKQGVLALHYYSLSDLNRLLNEIGYREEE